MLMKSMLRPWRSLSSSIRCGSERPARSNFHTMNVLVIWLNVRRNLSVDCLGVCHLPECLVNQSDGGDSVALVNHLIRKFTPCAKSTGADRSHGVRLDLIQ